MGRCVEKDGWKTVKGQYKPKKQRSFSWDISCVNRFDILKDNDEIQQNETEKLSHTYVEKQEKKETIDKIIGKDNNMEIFNEKYDVELVTNDALIALLESLNEEHLKAQQDSNKIIKTLKYDIVMKKEKLKEELKTARKLNDQYKNQLQKNTNEKKEYEKKYSEMKSKMTEIEAQMLLFQDTLNHNEELK